MRRLPRPGLPIVRHDEPAADDTDNTLATKLTASLRVAAPLRLAQDLQRSQIAPLEFGCLLHRYRNYPGKAEASADRQVPAECRAIGELSD